jgi:uncharacterized protein YndB with AHSA1/START domain
MTARANYMPGAATEAQVQKDGEEWTLILVRDLRQPPTMVWQALTEPEQLREWAPFDADRNLDATGPVVLATVGARNPENATSSVTRADAPNVLEYNWGGNRIRWELKPYAKGTRLTLWHSINRRYVSMGAAGWHICLDVLDHFLAGDPIGRIVGPDAMKFQWQRLNSEYARQFGVKPETTPPEPET